MLNDAFYGSAEGGWLYELVNADVDEAVRLGLLLAASAVALWWASRRLVDRRPALVLAVWLVLGTGAQMLVRTLAPRPDRDLVGTRFDHFHQTARAYPPGQYLRDSERLAPQLHFHVRANMAGKVLFYHLLRVFTDEPEALVWLILAVSNAGGLLAYAVARELFADRAAGLAALALYLFLPSKLFFFPLLNAVTPVFVLLPLWLLVRFLAGRRRAWLVALGVALYWLVLFEPLPLVTGLVFLALITRAWGLGAVGARDVLAVFVVVPAAFFAADLCVYRLFGYEVVRAFLFALRDARQFNAATGRPYDLWVVQNLIDTLANTGAITSALLVGIAAVGVGRIAVAAVRKGRCAAGAVAAEPALALALSVLASLAAVDLMGINRGETIRLWIFLGAFMQLPAAGFCARRPVLFSFVLALSILQACVGVASRGFVVPG